MTTTNKTSAGSYYHTHIKPSQHNNHIALDPIHLNHIPPTAKVIRQPSSWLLATEWEPFDHKTNDPPVLTIWIKSSKKNRHLGQFHGMRFLNVDPHHVGGLHAGNIPQVVTKRKLERSPRTIKQAKAANIEQAQRVKRQRMERAKRGLVKG